MRDLRELPAYAASERGFGTGRRNSPRCPDSDEGDGSGHPTQFDGVGGIPEIYRDGDGRGYGSRSGGLPDGNGGVFSMQPCGGGDSNFVQLVSDDIFLTELYMQKRRA